MVRTAQHGFVFLPADTTTTTEALSGMQSVSLLMIIYRDTGTYRGLA